MRYLSASYVFPVSSPPLKYGIICIDNDGRIVDIIDTDGKLEKRKKLEFYNGILVPGFVNAHCHLELSHLHNIIEPYCGLPEFISSIGMARKSSRETIIKAAKSADEQMTKNGIVAVGDISNNADTLDIKYNSKIRYQTFVELFGLNGNRSKEIFAAGQNVKDEYDKAGMAATLAPHAIYSLSPQLWEILHQSYKSSPPDVISMHHQESGEEMNIYFEGKGELADMFRKNGFFNNSIVPSKDILLQMMNCFLKTSRCLLVHNTFMNRSDFERYIPNLDKFFFILCPASNLYIQNRLPNMQLFALPEFSQNTCLGADSLASNKNLSILEEMKIIQQRAPDISLETLLRWATLNGAKALGFDSFCGSFEKGKTPGVNLITGIDFNLMKLTSDSKTLMLSPDV